MGPGMKLREAERAMVPPVAGRRPRQRLTGQGQVEVDLQIRRNPQESIINEAADASLTSGRTAKSCLIGWLTCGSQARRKNKSSLEVLEWSHLTQAGINERTLKVAAQLYFLVCVSLNSNKSLKDP